MRLGTIGVWLRGVHGRARRRGPPGGPRDRGARLRHALVPRGPRHEGVVHERRRAPRGDRPASASAPASRTSGRATRCRRRTPRASSRTPSTTGTSSASASATRGRSTRAVTRIGGPSPRCARSSTRWTTTPSSARTAPGRPGRPCRASSPRCARRCCGSRRRRRSARTRSSSRSSTRGELGELLGPDALLVVEQKVVLSDEPRTARERARAALAWYLDTPNYLDNLRWLGFADDDFEDGGSDALVDALVAAGDADAIVARCRAHLDGRGDPGRDPPARGGRSVRARDTPSSRARPPRLSGRRIPARPRMCQHHAASAGQARTCSGGH